MIRLRAMINWLRLLRTLNRMPSLTPARDSIYFHYFGYLKEKQVIREDFLMQLCEARRVIHFGFLDVPFTIEKIRAKALLHLRIKEVARFLYGVDIDPVWLERYRHMTGDTENAILDVEQDLTPNDLLFLRNQYDIILFPEVLEHIQNPGKALLNLRKICSVNAPAKLCITVPNAFSAAGFFAAIEGNEIVHPGHYYYFSPATITKLLNDIGFSRLELFLYSHERLVGSPGLTGHGIIAICEG